jgi:hypothetical protein
MPVFGPKITKHTTMGISHRLYRRNGSNGKGILGTKASIAAVKATNTMMSASAFVFILFVSFGC